jgi:nucleotide-binding universal stress UspA family protein
MIELNHILVPTDFSKSGRNALKYAVTLADEFGSAVHLLHVVEPIPPGVLMSRIPMEDFRTNLMENAQQQMDELRNLWSEYNFPVTEVIKEGNPFVEIIQFARENDVDLIILGTHGRGAIQHALMGSVAEKTVRKAPCPVLTVRDPEHEFIHP